MENRYHLYNGDCLDVLRRLPDNSFDAVVTDPPYGLSQHTADDVAAALRAWLAGEEYRHRRAGFMGRTWDAFVPGPEVWRECLRVLKPGGHLVAFFGTRTYDLGVMAIRLAGFECRDQLAFMFGTGFPKSLDVSKAIDKRRDEDRPAIYAVTSFVADARDRAGLKNKDIDAAFGFAGMAGHWTSRQSQPSVPTWDQWLALKDLMRFGDEMDAEVWRLNGRKGKPGDAWDQREVVGTQEGTRLAVAPGQGADRPAVDLAITAPATDAARRWQGWGTALKPAYEPILLARKPIAGTVAENVLAHGTGALNVGGCRVPGEKPQCANVPFAAWRELEGREDRQNPGQTYDHTQGRWPANLLHDGSDEVLAAFAEFGESKSRPTKDGGEFPTDNTIGLGLKQIRRPFHVDEGTAARFFQSCPLDEEDEAVLRFHYSGKASRADRDEGLDDLPERSGGEACDREDGSAGLESPRAGAGRTGGARNTHPTVKPTSVMRWLVRLVCPPGGTVLDPFAGSGSTGKAAVLEGFRFVGIEREAEYIEIARRRIAHAAAGGQVPRGKVPPSAKRNPPARTVPVRSTVGAPDHAATQATDIQPGLPFGGGAE